MSRKIHFIKNVLWSWTEVGISIFAALVLAPIIIRRLGDENYGLWTLTISLVEYSWLLDFGLRGATIKYAAHYRATGEKEKVNSVINSAMLFAAALVPVIIGIVILSAPWLAARFNVLQPALFARLIVLAVASWALGTIGNSFSAALEGFQRFDYTSQAYIISTASRNMGVFVLLLMGFGVLEMAWLSLAVSALLLLLNILFLKRAFPEHRFAAASANRATLKELMQYGMHGLTASLGQRILNQSTPLLIGSYVDAKSVGYFSAPSKLLDYSVEVISRIGMVSNPNAAEFVAHGRFEQLRKMAIDASRYSLTLYLPAPLFLAAYGHELLSVWISPAFAAKASGVLPALLLGAALGTAAQYSSGSILFGMGKHRLHARALLVEGVLSVVLTILVLPRYGIVGAAWVRSALMLLNRGFGTAYFLNRELHTPYWDFVARVYGPPLAVGAPVLALLFWMKTLAPGNNWAQLIAAGVLGSVVYLVLAYRFCLRQEHQSAFRRALADRIPLLQS